MSGLFITFEGLDGCGKSSHLRRAAAWLRERGCSVTATQEPGGTALGEELRRIFLDSKWKGLDGRVELLVVFASRRQHLLEVIEPALAAGEIVLCDRFTDSTRAYQGFGRGVPEELVDAVDAVATGNRRPDLTLLFDAPTDVAAARIAAKLSKGDRGEDRLDNEAIAFRERVRAGYRALVAREPERFRVIDSSGPVETTAAEVRRVLTAAVAPVTPLTPTTVRDEKAAG